MQTRSVINREIDWVCNIKRLYSDDNLGCSIGPVSAINWFFDQVEEGIILEDDCIPHPDFLAFSADLLKRYRHDQRVWCIGGVNFQSGIQRGPASYYFSRYNHCWGWASWRRCWQHFDVYMNSWPEFQISGLIDAMFDGPRERRYWQRIWSRTYERSVPVTWWDYQWTFTCLINNGLTVLPNANLVTNVGFDDDASHTQSAPASIRNAQVRGLGLQGQALKHPEFVLADRQADRYTFSRHFKGSYSRRILNRLSKLNPGKRL